MLYTTVNYQNVPFAKMIHERDLPDEQKVQPAPSFYSATEVILLKRKPLTSTTVLLFKLCEHEAVKDHSRQQGEKMSKKKE